MSERSAERFLRFTKLPSLALAIKLRQTYSPFLLQNLLMVKEKLASLSMSIMNVSLV